MNNPDDVHVTGTLIWYYYICRRQVWLMSHQINPDEDDPNLDLGRFIHEQSYQRDKKEISLGNIKIDILRKDKNEIIVGEVKKSSKFEKSAKMQLSYYLSELERVGISARGELYFPKEKKKTLVVLTDQLRDELMSAVENILKIVYLDESPEPIKINWCRNCAYSEFCWS
jgi:CRISPR-associated exonuclease Cas4